MNQCQLCKVYFLISLLYFSAINLDHQEPHDANVFSASNESTDHADEDTGQEDEYEDTEVEEEDSDSDTEYIPNNEFQETETDSEYAIFSLPIHSFLVNLEVAVTVTNTLIFLLQDSN